MANRRVGSKAVAKRTVKKAAARTVARKAAKRPVARKAKRSIARKLLGTALVGKAIRSRVRAGSRRRLAR